MARIKQLVFITALFIYSTAVNAQKKYALLIGINDYYEVQGVKSEVSLRGSVNDANSIRSLLIDKFGFEGTNIDTIYNAEATRDHIIAGLKKKLAQCKPGDAMVFYFSGHGVYMYNSDEDKDSVKHGMNQAMLTSDLYNYGDHLKCFLRDFTLKQYFNLFVDKKVILTSIFDCCFSGNLVMSGPGADLTSRGRSIDLEELLGRLTANAENIQLLMDSIIGKKTIVTGCSTDSAGALSNKLDADGDGIPDCRDKEKYTAKECFPVNEEGIGSCPFDYLLRQFHATLNKYDSTELALAKANSSKSTRSFAVGAVVRVAEVDSIQRPVDRKASRFLFMSAATDTELASEFADANGVLHGLFTAAILRTFDKYPASSNITTVFEYIKNDMNGFHRSQTPTMHADPTREKRNLLGL